ncbi:MAG: AIR synthase related protein [Archaeoglobaceae archaeon]|nr:AIR synthase related protein [Archaeoglobaceae archaeon]MDW8118444.1 AIR synthase related protein [Archaeoglobaceae archaeon]
MANFDLNYLISELRNWPGLVRKKFTGRLAELVDEFFGEDAGYFALGDWEVVFTVDGIWHKVLEEDLYWGGFISILVNVHDVYAMGARARYAVNVISVKDASSLEAIKNGMLDAARKYGIKILKGHVHPDAPFNSVEVAMIGFARKGTLIKSNTAKEGDSIIVAVDTIGEPHEKLIYNFDSTKKDAEIIRKQLEAMVYLGEKKLVNAGKDLSNAGIIGTIAMMLEVSKKGALIELENIPKPEKVEMLQWLKSYPACGFCVTSEQPEEVLKVFKSHGLNAEVVGKVDSTRAVKLAYKGIQKTFFDFRKESVLGLI